MAHAEAKLQAPPTSMMEEAHDINQMLEIKIRVTRMFQALQSRTAHPGKTVLGTHINKHFRVCSCPKEFVSNVLEWCNYTDWTSIFQALVDSFNLREEKEKEMMKQVRMTWAVDEITSSDYSEASS